MHEEIDIDKEYVKEKTNY